MLVPGDLAPDFTLVAGDGTRHSLSSYRGSIVVLYFYPRDLTPGCTREACDFRDAGPEVKRHGVVVMGVSPDPPNRHTRFAEKYELNFPLLSDEEFEVSQLYGVWKKKKLYGKTFLGIERSTFIIDGEGVIRWMMRGVRVKDHVTQVLQQLNAMKSTA